MSVRRSRDDARDGAPRGPEPEFEDEAPGSYLSELGTRRGSVVWGAINVAATLTVAAAALTSRLGPKSEWRVLARLVWILLPISSVLLLVLTLWQLGTAYTEKRAARMLLALGLSVAGITLWLLFSNLGDEAFFQEQPP
ncbi:MAG TPA: hypothetical protein VMT52_14025 [Planctomycetota bacterium]|nr:hypothetical protein [Planctomycetota bacterium]